MTRHVVARVGDVPPGSRVLVTLDGREIGVFNVDGEFFAVRNRCPHQAGPLCEGILTRPVSSTRPGEYAFTEEGGILRCPWHQWEFDLATGRSWCDPDRVRVRSYPVVVERGGADVHVPGPYTAETFPVAVEDEYVVVDLGGRLPS